jgi:Toxin PAAR-like domain
MPVDTVLVVLSIAFPDVCKAIVGPAVVPLPLVNIMLSSARMPMVVNVMFGGGMTLNLFGVGAVSTGDEAGPLLGAVSQTIVGPGRVVLGSVKLFLGCAPATRMGGITAQNGFIPNACGVTSTPGQIRVFVVM